MESRGTLGSADTAAFPAAATEATTGAGTSPKRVGLAAAAADRVPSGTFQEERGDLAVVEEERHRAQTMFSTPG